MGKIWACRSDLPATPICRRRRVEHMIGLTKARFPRPPQFLLCVLPEKKNSDLYGSWKKKNLHELGVVTQCIAPIKISDQYLTNVLLKINSKHVFQSPNECEERHKILMESNVYGADSAEDSGSSQQYKSTLPGIPKGCARQLFQNLEAPVGEYTSDDTINARLEMIISIGYKLHSFRTLNDTQAPEKITPAHNSHAVALSQVCPNNRNVSTPFDLSDAITSNSDALTHGYQGSQTHSSYITSHQISSSPVIYDKLWCW